MFSVVSASELCVVPILLGISVELPFHLFYYFDVVLADFLNQAKMMNTDKMQNGNTSLSE